MRLSSKLILFLLSAVVSVMAVYALVTMSRTQDRMEEELMKMADHLGMALSVGVLHHLESGDAHGVSQVLETMRRYEDVVGIAVYGAGGGLVAAAGEPVAAAGQAELGPAAADSLRARGAAPYTHRQAIVDAAGDTVGSLRLAITGHSLMGYVVEARNHILLTIAVLTGVIALCIVYFSRRYLAGPLAQLTAGADAVGRGELDRRIEVGGEGEVAALARAFNGMAANLQAATRQTVDEREYIRSVVDSLPEGIVVVDRARRVTAWNLTMAQRYGHDAASARGRPLAEALPGLWATSLADDLAVLLDGHRATVELSRVHLPEDADRVLTVTAAPLRLRAEAVEGAVLVLADVTEQLRLEAQVQRSDKLAAVGQLAAGLAHEIGTPLNVISGTAEYLRVEHAEQEELQTIVEEVRRISDLVQRLMRFARQEEPRVEAVHVREVVDSVLSLMQHQMGRKGVEVEVSVPPGLPPVAADRSQLQQVLVNLAMNAWQAMPEGGRLRIAARPGDDTQQAGPCPCPGGFVAIDVADTGEGIAEEHLARVFEPFFTTKEIGEGTGLGLAIVQRIVEDHDGSLDVRSRVGHGTVVEVRLPTCAATDATRG